jgi:hypothetical protein
VGRVALRSLEDGHVQPCCRSVVRHRRAIHAGSALRPAITAVPSTRAAGIAPSRSRSVARRLLAISAVAVVVPMRSAVHPILIARSRRTPFATWLVVALHRHLPRMLSQHAPGIALHSHSKDLTKRKLGSSSTDLQSRHL